MFLSVFLLLLGGISLIISGFPLTYIFFKNSKSISIESLWGISFFVGYAIITSLIKTFLFFNIPIKYSAFPVFFLLIIIFIIFIVIIKKRKQRIMPAKWFLLLLLSVISVSSIGFIISGAENYILYGWWDITNYIQQAEAFKELPYASWNEISYNNPWLLAAQSFFEGWHRISFASFQGFIATISLTDVSKVVGMSGSISIMLIAMALVYLTDGIKMGLFYRWCAIFFGATCPIIILAELECFLPICFFIGMSILSCKIFIELLKSPSLGKTLIVGCLISSYATTLLDGIYIILGLSLVSAVCLLFFNKIKIKSFLSLFGSYFIAIILNVPILRYIIEELGNNMSRSGLNSIYDFAYTKDALTYSFFNFRVGGSNEKIAFIIAFISVILFLAGIIGLFYELLSKKQLVLFNGVILLSLPLLFFCQQEELQYAFFKIFQFGFPLIILGDFLFLQTCVYEFKKMYCVKNTFNVFMEKLVIICMCVSILCFFSLSTYRSIEANYQGSVKGIGNHKFRSFAPNDQLWELWNKLNKQSGKNILFIGRCDNIPNTMSVYFNRKNNVYLLTKEQYVDIKRTQQSQAPIPNIDEITIPDDVEFQFSGVNNMFDDNSQSAKYAAVLEFVLQERPEFYNILDGNSFELGASNLRISYFARQKTNAVIYLNGVSTKDGTQTNIIINGISYHVSSDSTDLVIPVTLEKGRGEIFLEVESNVPVTIKEYSMEAID